MTEKNFYCVLKTLFYFFSPLSINRSKALEPLRSILEVEKLHELYEIMRGPRVI